MMIKYLLKVLKYSLLSIKLYLKQFEYDYNYNDESLIVKTDQKQPEIAKISHMHILCDWIDFFLGDSQTEQIVEIIVESFRGSLYFRVNLKNRKVSAL